MDDVTAHLKGLYPFLSVTWALFVYTEDYSENMQNSLLWTCFVASTFAISKAILAEIFAFATWTGMYHMKLVEREIFDLTIIHVFCVPMTMVIIHPSLHWLLKLSLIFALFLMLLVVNLLLRSLTNSKQSEKPASKTYHRNGKTEDNRMKTLPECYKESVPSANVFISAGASGDSRLNSFPTSAAQSTGNLLTGRSSREIEHHLAVSNRKSTESMTESQELHKVQLSRATQAGVSSMSMVESSTLTTTPCCTWNAFGIRTRQGTEFNSDLLNPTFYQDRPMSVSQTSTSSQTSNNTSTSSDWKVHEYKTRNGNTYKVLLWNEKLRISRPIDPAMLYQNEGQSDYSANSST